MKDVITENDDEMMEINNKMFGSRLPESMNCCFTGSYICPISFQDHMAPSD